MVRSGREQLNGLVEIDETYLSITDHQEPISPINRKSNTSKVLVAIAVEILEPKGFGRIRLRRIDDDSERCVLPFVQDAIETGARIRSDGSAAYRSFKASGYEHQRTVVSGAEIAAHVSLPGVHRVASLLRRWIMGTHHGAVQPLQLDHYLDEYVFRFNRRKSGSRGMLFYRLLEQAVAAKPVTYSKVVKRPGLHAKVMPVELRG